MAELQRVCFPPPFPEAELWNEFDLSMHTLNFSEGQFVVELDGLVVASCTNVILNELTWQNRTTWMDLSGGKSLSTHDPEGSTLFGVDISVHPDIRRRGIAKLLYRERVTLASQLGLNRFATACRLPGLISAPELSPEEFTQKIVNHEIVDMPMTAFLNLGMKFFGVAHNFMDDIESRNCNAILEYRI